MRGIVFVLCIAATHGLVPIHPPDPSLIGALQHSGAAFVGKAAHMYTNALVEHPLATKMATGGVLATAGDAIAQSQTEDPYDKRRAASFMLFDMAYRALQHASFPIIVHEFHGQYLGSIMKAVDLHLVPMDYSAAMEQTLASQLGIVPFLYYPVFFSLTAYVQGLSKEGAIERAKEMFVPLMKRNLLFWIPVQFVQFGFIDEQLQIPFLSAAGLCWTFILSVAAGSAKSYDDDQATATQQLTAQLPPVEETSEADPVYAAVSEKALTAN